MKNIINLESILKARKYHLIFCFILFFIGNSSVLAQKELGDVTIHYTVRYMKDSSLVNAIKTVYIHGDQVRTDFSYEDFLQTIITNANTGVVQILKEIQGNKYKTVLDSSQWAKCNDVYKNAVTSIMENDVSIILGYRCGKALLTLSDGNKYFLYYTLDVVPSIKENIYQFANIPGLILQYESASDNNGAPIEIHAKSINLMPISSHLFNVPTKGYRILRNPNF